MTVFIRVFDISPSCDPVIETSFERKANDDLTHVYVWVALCELCDVRYLRVVNRREEQEDLRLDFELDQIYHT